MAKRVIVLERIGGDDRQWRVALWVSPPVARQPFYARDGAVSEWKDAQASDNSAIASGAVVEVLETVDVQGLNQTQARNRLEGLWNEVNAKIQAANPWDRYGTVWDGVTGWANAGAA